MGYTECTYMWVDGTRICSEHIWKGSEKYCIFHDPTPKKNGGLFNQMFQEKLHKKNYDFRGYHFPEGFTFEEEEFDMPVTFENAFFYSIANFERTRFADTDFSNSIFSSWVFFGKATFSTDVNFTGAKFRGVANFNGATFSGKTDFTETVFSDDAIFENTTFEKGVDFGNAHFLKHAAFRKSIFTQGTKFLLTRFAGEAVFNVVKFSGPTTFMGSFFSEKTQFGHAISLRGMDFSDAQFSGKVEFSESVFSESVDFTGAVFCDSVDFGGVRFSKEVFFADTCFEGGLNFENCKFLRSKTTPPFKSFSRLESGYRKLKNYLNERGDYATAGNFYYLEMDSKRKCSHGFRRLWLELYRFICGYGENPLRVLSVSLLIIMMWAGVFLFSGFVVNPSSPNERVIDYSLAVPSQISFDNFCDLCYCVYCSVVTFTTLGYGDIDLIGYSRIFASIEAFIGVFFVALFVLVFGRKMMR
jgi:uncharacterized protein YjbI with pentapeptide repeats